MARVDWLIEGKSYGNCNCDYGCPCQFESLPTHGGCSGFEVFEIEKGHFGETKLDGLRAAVIYSWPGPIFEGKGQLQVVIDEKAKPAQREALKTVLHGGETEEAANHWWVFSAMSDTHHPTLYKPINLEVDIEARTATASISGILNSEGRPIKSPATGDNHRVRIDIPGGIEFDIAEIGSASTTTIGAIAFTLKDSYGQFNRLRQHGGGVVR
ncbi:MAG: DUF1326 domain-containing protein [Rhizobiales bacterium]|nr:DUF1326 domain-containing protein [Hyphomicrobiales bacterium]